MLLLLCVVGTVGLACVWTAEDSAIAFGHLFVPASLFGHYGGVKGRKADTNICISVVLRVVYTGLQTKLNNNSLDGVQRRKVLCINIWLVALRKTVSRDPNYLRACIKLNIHWFISKKCYALYILPTLVCFKYYCNLNHPSTSISYTPFNNVEIVKYVPLVLTDEEEFICLLVELAGFILHSGPLIAERKTDGGSLLHSTAVRL